MGGGLYGGSHPSGKADGNRGRRPKITLDLSSLDQIRQDAQATRDSLLTEEEMDKGTEEEKVPAAPPMPSEPELVTESIAGLDPVHTRILLGAPEWGTY